MPIQDHAEMNETLPNVIAKLKDEGGAFEKAFGTPEIIADAEALGAIVINKPFELDALMRLVT